VNAAQRDLETLAAKRYRPVGRGRPIGSIDLRALFAAQVRLVRFLLAPSAKPSERVEGAPLVGARVHEVLIDLGSNRSRRAKGARGCETELGALSKHGRNLVATHGL
jgi:hypothetical protein